MLLKNILMGESLLPNYTFFIQLGLFFVCYFVLNRFVFAPYLRLLEERKAKTVGLKEQAEKDKLKAQELKVAYESYLKEERRKLGAWYDEEKKGIEEVAKKQIEAARGEVSSHLKKQKEVQEGETRQVVSELEAKVPEYTSQILEKILGKKISMTLKSMVSDKEIETRV